MKSAKNDHVNVPSQKAIITYVWHMTKFSTLFAIAATITTALAITATQSSAAKGVAFLRLLEGHRQADGTHLAAIHIQLEPNWKTYWRAPGEGGFPPQFDWSKSKNLKAVQIHWPAPKAYTQNGVTTIGYIDELILPITFTPKDKSAPISLKSKIDFGTCRDICVPQTANVSAKLSQKPARPDTRIRSALKTTIRAAKIRAKCEISPISDGLKITVHLPAGNDKNAITAIEMKPDTYWVSNAVTIREKGRVQSTADIIGPTYKPFSLNRSDLLITVIGKAGAVEYRGCDAL
ncbi:MAG: protein-disulfide reductase DsbD domain-containing protein [Halocynthiibacter sp.]